MSRPPSTASQSDEERNGEPPADRSFVRSWQVWAGLLISVALLFIAFRGQSPEEILAALRRFDTRWLVPALLLFLSGVWIRAIRWSILLRPLVPVSAREIFPVIVAGYTANNVLPLRTGELVRAYLVRQRFGIRKTAALATIAVERLFDGLAMLVFIFVAMTVISLTAELQHLALISAAIFAGALLGMVLLTLGGNVRDRLLQLALGPLPPRLADRVERMALAFLGGLGVLRRKGDLTLVALTSIVAWGFEASVYWTLAQGFGGELAAAMGVPAALLTTGVASLATLVPAAPGYVGTYEAGVALVLHGALGVSRGLSLSYAILVHAAIGIPITIAGAIVWWRFHFSLAQARRNVGDDNGFAQPTGEVATSEASRR